MADREIVANELRKIEDRYGRITPERVVEACRDGRHPLHSEFDWDNNIAGYKWRIEQARRLIRSVTVEIITEIREIKAPVYLRDPSADANEQGYRSITKLRQSDDARDAVLAEFSRAESHLRRAFGIAIALDYASDIDDLINRLSDLANKVTPSPDLAAA